MAPKSPPLPPAKVKGNGIAEAQPIGPLWYREGKWGACLGTKEYLIK